MRKVLLIEDNPGDVYLVKKALSKAAQTYVVEHVSRLADALRHPELESFDVILADLSLPDSSGIQSATALRERLPNLPLIVLTSLANDGVALQTLELGAQDYLVKDDINTEVLRRAIHYAVQRQLIVNENQKLMGRLADSKALLKRKNRRLKRLFQAAQQGVDNVSHEFRTPLTVIKEYAWLICDGMAGAVNEEQQRMLNVVIDRADDLNTMVDDMLDSSKMEAGLLGAWRKACSVDDAVRHVLSTLQRKAEVRGVRLETTIDEHLPLIYCDGEKLGRVIINLAVNAIKFCGQAGTVNLWAKENALSKEVVIGVTDDGPGIAEDQLEAIFARFKQLENAIPTSTKGFGLGLNIAKDLVELNLGKISVASNLGTGSTFSFTVPWADPTEVTGRYLSQLAARRDSSTVLSLVTAELDDGVDEQLCHDVDAFLSYQLRRNDLLFRASQHSWLMLVLSPELELDQFHDRLDHSQLAVNRNRPYAPLPEIGYTTIGSWDITTDRDFILSQVHNCCSATAVVCG